LPQPGGEGYDVVVNFGFDGVDAVFVEIFRPAGLQVFHRFRGYVPQPGEGLAGQQLHFQPAAVLGLVAPQGGHGGAGITGNHRLSPLPAVSWGLPAPASRRGSSSPAAATWAAICSRWAARRGTSSRSRRARMRAARKAALAP